MLTFPAEVVLTASTSCLASISTNGASMSCAVNVTAQQVKVVAASVQILVYAAQSSLPVVTLVLTSVRNPQSVKPSSQLIVQSYLL